MGFPFCSTSVAITAIASQSAVAAVPSDIRSCDFNGSMPLAASLSGDAVSSAWTGFTWTIDKYQCCFHVILLGRFTRVELKFFPNSVCTQPAVFNVFIAPTCPTPTPGALSTGAIVGIAIGAVVGAAVVTIASIVAHKRWNASLASKADTKMEQNTFHQAKETSYKY